MQSQLFLSLFGGQERKLQFVSPLMILTIILLSMTESESLVSWQLPLTLPIILQPSKVLLAWGLPYFQGINSAWWNTSSLNQSGAQLQHFYHIIISVTILCKCHPIIYYYFWPRNLIVSCWFTLPGLSGLEYKFFLFIYTTQYSPLVFVLSIVYLSLLLTSGGPWSPGF